MTNVLQHGEISLTIHHVKTAKNVFLMSSVHLSVSTVTNQKETLDKVAYYNGTKYGVEKGQRINWPGASRRLLEIAVKLR
jgi:hypothetical protein